jgi:hypothetical protein
MKKFCGLAITFLVLLANSGCLQPTPQPSTNSSDNFEPSVSIVAVGDIPLNTWFPVQITVKNAPPSSALSLTILGVGDVVSEVTDTTLRTDARGTAQFETNVKVTRASHVSLVAGVGIANDTISKRYY